MTTEQFKSQGLVRAEFKSQNQLNKLHHDDVWLDAEAQGELGELVMASKYVVWGTPEAFAFMAENILDVLVYADLAPMSSVLSSWVSVARILFDAAGIDSPGRSMVTMPGVGAFA